MPNSYKNYKPKDMLSNGDIQKALGISRGLVSHLISHLNIPALKVQAPNGRILQYYDLEALTACKNFIEEHPDTRQYFCALYRETHPEEWKQVREQQQKTVETRYGVTNISQIPGMAQLKLDNFQARHGESFSSYMSRVVNSQEFQEKRVATCKQRYGSDYTQKLARKRQADISPEAHRRRAAKARQTCMEKYGVLNPSQLPDIKARIKCTKAVRREEIISHIQELGGLTESEILQDYGISDPCFRYHCQTAEVLIHQYHGYNYIMATDLERMKASLECVPTQRSGGEESLKQFLISVLPQGTEILQNKRFLPSKKELDFYIPSKNLAIEFNGLYWHSEASGKDSTYHLAKTEECQELGIRLIQVFEDEWLYKTPICKSIIQSALGQSIKIAARSCLVRELTTAEYKQFMNETHLQGCGPLPKRALGLFFEDTLMQAVGFGPSRYQKGDWELYRMASRLGYSIVGGFSKLMTHSHLDSCISYVDRRLFTGEGYKKAGFVPIGTSKPSYFYVKGCNRLNRLNYQKHKLEKKLLVFDPSKTEKENMLVNGYSLIYDCGTYKMRWQNFSTEGE